MIGRLPLLARDGLSFLLLATISLALGAILNALRPEPLPLLAPAALPEITAPVLQQLAASHDVVILDVRPYDFYANGHIPGAINLPLASLKDNAAVAAASLSKERPLVVYCSDASCPAAQLAGRILARLGYRHISVFPGGWYVWKKAALPVEMTP